MNAATFLAQRATRLAVLHPLVRAEVEAEVAFKFQWAAQNGKADIIWHAEDHPNSSLAICVWRVLGKLRRDEYGKAVPESRAELRAQMEAVAAKAGMAMDGRVVQAKGELG